MLSTKFFNLRLYLEALKRLKVIGLATAILSVTISGLIPVVQWMSADRYWEPQINTVEHQTLCLPLYATIFIAPFFFMSLFSFLNKRKESDFYHAIPYTRTCVYVSFVAAAMSFVFAIQIASALTAGVLWALSPYAVFRISELISLTLMCMLAAALLSSIMMLAITLTGTDMTTALMFFLFTLLTRLIMLYASECLQNEIWILPRNSIPFLDFTWFLPFAMFSFFIGGHNMLNDPFHSPGLVIYSLVVALLLFTVAWILYVVRKSEMAGNTAPNRLTQHIFRCLFALPIALLIPMVTMIDGAEPSLILVLVVITLLVFYLYELITTKRIKNLGAATAWLPVLLIACLLYCGFINFASGRIYANTPDDPDEVTSVQIDTNSLHSWDTYQASLIQKSSSSDPELIALVMKNLNQSVECDKDDHFEKYYADYKTDGGNYEYYYMDQNWITITLHLDNGKTVTRRIAFRGEDYERVKQMYIRTIEVDETLFWSIPEQKLVDSLEVSQYYQSGMTQYVHVGEMDDQVELYRTFAKEYNALSLEEKIWVRTTRPYDLMESETMVEENDSDAPVAEDESLTEQLPATPAPKEKEPQEDTVIAHNLMMHGHLKNSSTYFYIEFCVTEEMLPDTFRLMEKLIEKQIMAE